ncbi:MAG: hypothetical protein IKN47_03120 [Lachnospiraceae bacterium]|nr:hypothetical protein [Lachnospiraceae bacterium]
MKVYVLIFGVLVLIICGGCALKGQVLDGDDMVRSYNQITQDEAKKMMEKDDGHIIVDVRRQDEYDEGHIPGAVCIPNESITDTMPSLLPDSNQVILVYCRSGRRSKEAAQKLFDMGYNNVYEFGGILDWTGEIEKDYEDYSMEPVAIFVMRINDKYYSPDFEYNSSVEAFREKIKEEGTVTVKMQDYGNFEKVGELPWDIVTNDEKITTAPGDIILYQGNKISVYYDENTWDLTKIGHIDDVTKEELLNVFGDGEVTVEFFVEWTE